MKNFFKRLSLLLALIMLVSMTASAGPVYGQKTDTFKITQIATTKFNMIFNTEVNMSAEDVKVVILLNNMEADVPVKKVSVEENIATVELFAALLNGFTYKVTYNKETHEFIGSTGTIASVSFNYWSEEEGDNVAYVSTETEPTVTTLEYELYDANGVNITDIYDEDEFWVEYSIISDSEDFEVYDNQLICNKPGIVEIEVKVTWVSEDGEQVEAVGTNTVVAQKHPAIAFSQIEAGFINVDAYENGAQDSFVNDVKSPFWTNNTYCNSWVLGDKGSLQFAAVVEDSRGNTIVTGINEYGYIYAKDEEGNPMYPYGFFRFVSSNDEILDIDDNGILSLYSPGSAAIITYFVDTTGQREKEIFAGVTVITVHPERYVATYALADTSLAVASTTAGAENTASFVLTAYDQYGESITLKNGAADIKVETTSKSDTIPVREVNAVQSTEHKFSWGIDDCSDWGCGNSNGGVHYHIDFDGDKFKEYLDDQSAKAVRYAVTVDKEENEKLTTAETTNIKLTIKDTTDYVLELATGKTKKYYYSIEANKSSQDLAVTNIKDFMKTGAESTVKEAEITMNYLDSVNGFTMQAVPTTNIVLKGKKQTTGAAGTLYYEVTAPKSAKYWNYIVEDGKIRLTWNKTVGRNTFYYATTGTYTVTLYYVKNASSDKLRELASYSFEVTNSQAIPKFAPYESIQGSKTSIPIDKNSALAIVKENLKFSYNGEIIDWTNPGFKLTLKSPTIKDYKLKVNKVDIVVPIDDGDASTNYTYTTTLTVNKSIFYFEEE